MCLLPNRQDTQWWQLSVPVAALDQCLSLARHHRLWLRDTATVYNVLVTRDSFVGCLRECVCLISSRHNIQHSLPLLRGISIWVLPEQDPLVAGDIVEERRWAFVDFRAVRVAQRVDGEGGEKGEDLKVAVLQDPLFPLVPGVQEEERERNIKANPHLVPHLNQNFPLSKHAPHQPTQPLALPNSPAQTQLENIRTHYWSRRIALRVQGNLSEWLNLHKGRNCHHQPSPRPHQPLYRHIPCTSHLTQNFQFFGLFQFVVNFSHSCVRAKCNNYSNLYFLRRSDYR